MTSLLTQADGVSILTDYVYSNRFKHVPELVRMGAKIRVEGRSAMIECGQTACGQGERHRFEGGRGACRRRADRARRRRNGNSGVEFIDRGL